MSPAAAAALAPVTERLRRDAADRAARLRAAARAEAAEILQRAGQAAAAAADGASAAAAQTAGPVVAAELRRARAEARHAILAAQRAACDELRRQVRAGVAMLSAEADYARLAHRISELAEMAAGPGARLSQAPAGGVIATAPGVVVDCSLDRLADLAVARLGPAIRELWTA